MKTPVAYAVIAACFAMASSLPAQDRQPLVGSVVSENGKPLAGATVTLVESDVDLVGLDPVDVLHVTTDRRGRFVASALRGVRYAAFAVGPEVDGGALVTSPVGDLACGRQAVLRTVATGTSRPLLLQGLADWGEFADLRVRLTFSRCPGYHIELPIDKEGRIDVPASSVVGIVSLHDNAGGRLTGIHVLPGDQNSTKMPVCSWFDVMVVDEHDKPVAGAEVAVQLEDGGENFMTITAYGHSRGDSAVTNADGAARLRCTHWQHPINFSPDTFVVVASKLGFSEGASGWLYKQTFDGWTVQERTGKALRISLQAIKPAVALAVPKKELTSGAFAGKRAKLFAMANVAHVNNGMVFSYYLPRSYEFEFGADREWQLSPIAPTATDLILQLPPVGGRRVMMLPTKSPQLPSADLSTCELLSLQLLDVGSGPASAASVMLVPRHADTHYFRHLAPLVPDQAGRVDVLLQRGEWTLLAMDETTWVSVELSEWSGAKRLRLQLAEMPSRRVRVLDAEGQPAVGAKFESGSFRYAFPAVPGLPSVLRQMGQNTFASQVRRETTGANGEATLHFLPWPNIKPAAFAYLGDRRTRSEDTVIVEGEEVLVIHLK